MAYDEEALIRDLKALMKQRKRSARSISQAINVPYRSMQNYLSGESRTPAIVLIAILDELGADLRLLRSGDNLLRHADIYDAVHRVFGDYLSKIDLEEIGQRRHTNRRTLLPEDLEEQVRRSRIALELAVRLSEAYDEFVRNQEAPGQFPTVKELRERRAEADALDGRSGNEGDQVGQ